MIELYNAPPGRYKQDVYLLPKKMGKSCVHLDTDKRYIFWSMTRKMKTMLKLDSM